MYLLIARLKHVAGLGLPHRNPISTHSPGLSPVEAACARAMLGPIVGQRYVQALMTRPNLRCLPASTLLMARNSLLHGAHDPRPQASCSFRALFRLPESKKSCPQCYLNQAGLRNWWHSGADQALACTWQAHEAAGGTQGLTGPLLVHRGWHPLNPREAAQTLTRPLNVHTGWQPPPPPEAAHMLTRPLNVSRGWHPLPPPEAARTLPSMIPSLGVPGLWSSLPMSSSGMLPDLPPLPTLSDLVSCCVGIKEESGNTTDSCNKMGSTLWQI